MTQGQQPPPLCHRPQPRRWRHNRADGPSDANAGCDTVAIPGISTRPIVPGAGPRQVQQATTRPAADSPGLRCRAAQPSRGRPHVPGHEPGRQLAGHTGHVPASGRRTHCVCSPVNSTAEVDPAAKSQRRTSRRKTGKWSRVCWGHRARTQRGQTELSGGVRLGNHASRARVGFGLPDLAVSCGNGIPPGQATRGPSVASRRGPVGH